MRGDMKNFSAQWAALGLQWKLKILIQGFMLLVLHDDAAREYAYGPARGLPDVKLGAFPQALDDQARKDGWTVVSMKSDWKQVFAFEK